MSDSNNEENIEHPGNGTIDLTETDDDEFYDLTSNHNVDTPNVIDCEAHSSPRVNRPPPNYIVIGRQQQGHRSMAAGDPVGNPPEVMRIDRVGPVCRPNAKRPTSSIEPGFIDVKEYFKNYCDKKKSEEVTNSPTCPICMNTHSKIKKMNTDIVSTMCGHVFCRTCLDQVLKTNKKCPTCRKNLTGKNSFHTIYI